MEWVETTGKSIEEAKDAALDRLGVSDDDAEFEILEEPRSGLFGLMRGEARVRARIRPAPVRPKQDRRRGRDRSRDDATPAGGAVASDTDSERDGETGDAGGDPRRRPAARSGERPRDRPGDRPRRPRPEGGRRRDEPGTDREPSDGVSVDPAAVGAAAVAFVEGLVDAFGMPATTALSSVDSELEVEVTGEDLGLLIGPGGRTLAAIQDLARVAAQRRLGDHDTRLRVDVAGYRERRRAALERFARTVAAQVVERGGPLALEPMPSADRKVIHDVLATIEGVESHSEGDDPNRRVVVTRS